MKLTDALMDKFTVQELINYSMLDSDVEKLLERYMSEIQEIKIDELDTKIEELEDQITTLENEETRLHEALDKYEDLIKDTSEYLLSQCDKEHGIYEEIRITLENIPFKVAELE